MYHWLGRPFHKHKFWLRSNEDVMWLECNCGEQRDVPPERELEAYEKLREKDYDWTED